MSPFLIYNVIWIVKRRLTLHNTYTVRMINFNLNKGTFFCFLEAVAHAKEVSEEYNTECSVVLNHPDKRSLHLCNIKC